mgnify:CR=1 FL=1
MTLHQILESKVNRGETTWEAVLAEINQIKRDSRLAITLTASLVEASDEAVLSTTPSRSADPFNLTARKELFERMSDSARNVVSIISEEFNTGKSIGKSNWYRIVRKHLKKKNIVFAEREIISFVHALGELDG